MRESYELYGNYPNPFNPETKIAFALPESGRISLIVYDMLGRQVNLLVDGSVPAGVHTVEFRAGDIPSDVYLYRLDTAGGSFTGTMLLLK